LTALAIAACIVAPQGARADLEVCNNTSSSVVAVAIGYKDGERWVSEGWWPVPSNTCWTLIKGQLIARYYYVHAVDGDGAGVWDRLGTGSEIYMCTQDKKFLIPEKGESDDAAIKDCEKNGYKRTRFFEVDTQEQHNWRVRLEDNVHGEAKTQ
jgi:uncharacterized membrane protein